MFVYPVFIILHPMHIELLITAHFPYKNIILNNN